MTYDEGLAQRICEALDEWVGRAVRFALSLPAK